MLYNIDIKNIAVIENVSFAPKMGMSVLTGETGAGKSVIIDSVNLILGARANKGLVRYGEDRAVVSAMFSSNSQLEEILSRHGIENADEEIVIQREITSDGKSIARINGSMIPAAVLRDISHLLIDIHGQLDNQTILNTSKHIDFLDSYAGLYELRNEYADYYKRLKEIQNELTALNKNEQERLSRIDLLKYQTEELLAADLKAGEEEALREESLVIANAEKITNGVMTAFLQLYDNDSNAYDCLNRAVSALSEICGYDDKLAQIHERLSDSLYAVEDAAHELRDYGDRTEFDAERLEKISQRLDLIKKLERKYGATVEKCIEYLKNASSELDSLVNHDVKTEELLKEKEKVSTQLAQLADELTKKRTESAKKLSVEIELQLHELDMEKAEFKAEIRKSEEFLPFGMDIVEFMITANPGQPLNSLVKIASGGELSRVMLAMKTVLSKEDGVDTLIFDEIDTGVSGSAAQKIARKLSALGKFKQVICVSHQPQLAAAADYNFKIEKNSDNASTSTKITLLDYESRLQELARIIDGENITKASIDHAKEMLERGF